MIGDISIKEATAKVLSRKKLGQTAEQITESVSARLGQNIKKDTVYKRLYDLMNNDKACLSDYMVLSNTQDRYLNTYRVA